MRIWLLGLLALPMLVPAQSLRAQSFPLRSNQRIDLKTQLETGLRARRPAEFAFIANVVALVDQGRLSRKLVQETFDWARKKRVRYPYIYFERALQIRAARVGVVIEGTVKR